MREEAIDQTPKIGTVIAAMFLVAGTIIGGGMLALPVATGVSGFWPATFFMVICWLMMTLTALMFLDVSLWMEEGAHIITMTSRILGPWGKRIAWVLYLFICYASLVAYNAGGSLQLVEGFQTVFGLHLSKGWGTFLFVTIFASVLFFGNLWIGRINTILFLAMLCAYFALIATGLDEIKPALLTHAKWSSAWLAIPLFLTSFSFQTMVPSLTPYLKRHVKSLRYAIIGGTTLSLVVYLVWQLLILGIVPVEGPFGLAEALRRGEPATQFVGEHVNGWHVGLVAQFFAFFAIVTSFLGIGLGLIDFLSDGLKIPENGWGRLLLSILIAVPTWFFSSYFERIFYLALDATGGYGDAILNGMIPVLLVWIGRYHLGFGRQDSFNFLERKPLLCIVFMFFCSIFLFKLGLDLGFIPSDIFMKNS